MDHRPIPAHAVERLEIDGVEAFADAEHEDREDEQRDQHREGDADLDHERHAARAGGGKDQAVLHRHEADDLRHRVAPHDHHQEAQQDDGERQRQLLAGMARRSGRDLEDQRLGEAGEREPDHQGDAHAHHLLDLAMDAEPRHRAVQGQRE